MTPLVFNNHSLMGSNPIYTYTHTSALFALALLPIFAMERLNERSVAALFLENPIATLVLLSAPAEQQKEKAEEELSALGRVHGGAADNAGDADVDYAQEDRVFVRTGSHFFPVLTPKCPEDPVYPPTVSMMDMITNWNPDDATIPPKHYNSLCRFDCQRDYAKALRYRDAEVPFILHNISELDKTVEKWNTPGYLEVALGSERKYDVKISKSNHFLHHTEGKKIPGYNPPTKRSRMTYRQWLGKVAELGDKEDNMKECEHYYLYVSQSDHAMIQEDLSIFNFSKSNLFMKVPSESKGIECRFGAPNVVAEAHYDGHNNMVAFVKGRRRWILAPPAECQNAYLRKRSDPSSRHSQVDWSKPDLEKWPKFKEMQGLEAIMTPGDVLYVPSFWMHFIQNLDVNAQCNARSNRAEIGSEATACIAEESSPSQTE